MHISGSLQRHKKYHSGSCNKTRYFLGSTYGSGHSLAVKDRIKSLAIKSTSSIASARTTRVRAIFVLSKITPSRISRSGERVRAQLKAAQKREFSG